MKKIIIHLSYTFLLLAIFSSCGDSAKTTTVSEGDSTKTNSVVYTCSMHPEVLSDKSGNCPKCGMELIVKK